MLETLYPRNSFCYWLMGQGPPGQEKHPSAQAKTWRGSSLKRLTSSPGHWAPSFCLGRGVFFLPRRALAHESVAKGVSSIRGF